MTDPGRTESSLLSTKTQLRALVLREAGLLASLSQQLEDHSKMVSRLVRRIDKAVEDINRPSSSATTMEMMDRQGNLLGRSGTSRRSGKDDDVEEEDDVEAEDSTDDEDLDLMSE